MNRKIGLKVVSAATLCSMIGYTLPVFAYTKEETVYSKLDAAGNNYKTIVSDHLQNSEESDEIKDLSDLLGIKNTNGDEEFSQDGNTLVWKANKNDIYYQGESQKELPVECNIKYELDGKEVSKDEIAGKSGKVKIALEYTNKEERYVNVNGKTVKMYVPFVVTVGTIFDNDNNKNITVSTGKVVNDGSKTVVVGLAMPGLQESLDVSKSDVDIPSNIEITMDTTKFETSSIVSYVTPKVFNSDDLDVFDKMDDIYSQVDELKTASVKIQDGANQLSDGANQLNSGVNQLQTGATQLQTGANQLANGAKQVDSGAGSLNDGASKLASGTATLSSGAKQVSDNMGAITSGASELSNGQTKVTNGLAQIKESLPTSDENEKNSQTLNYLNKTNTATVASLTDANTELEAQKTDVTTKLAAAKQQLADVTAQKAAVQAQITQVQTQITQAQTAGLPESTISALQGAEKTLTGTVKSLTDTETAINGTILLLTQTQTSLETSFEANNNLIKLISGDNQVVQSSLNTIDSMKTLSSAVDQLQSGSNQLQSGANQLQAGSTKLAAGAKQVASGSVEVNTGANQLATGASTLKNGTADLANGASDLATGTDSLVSGTNDLASGANDLANGASDLASGIKEFNEEGINKICDLVNGDVKDIATRAEKLTDLSKDYNTFTMLDDGNEGSVDFIMVIDGIKEKTDSEQNKEEAITDSENKDNTTAEEESK